MRSSSVTFVAASLVLASACGWDDFDPRVATTTSASGGASSGGGGGAGGDVGGQGGGGGAPPLECGTLALLSDDFEDATLDSQRFLPEASYGAVTEAAGSLTLTVSTGSTAAYGHIVTHQFQTMRDTAVAVEVSSSTLTGSAFGMLRLFRSDSDDVRLVLQGATLRAELVLNGQVKVLASSAYVANEHRFWRIREEDGVVFWEVSADANAWTELAQRATAGLFSLEHVRLQLRAAAGGTARTVAETFVVDALEITGLGVGAGWCPMSTLRDAFDDTRRDDIWLRSTATTGSGAVEIDGSVFMNLVAGTDPAIRYISSQKYDLTADQVTLELAEHGDGGVTSVLELARIGQSITLQITDVDDGNGNITTEIQAITDVDGDVQVRGTRLFDPSIHRFLRIRHDGVGLIWDTSGDGMSWPTESLDDRTIAQTSPTPAGLEVNDLEVRFGVRATTAALSPGQTRFDNLNVLPSE